MINGVDEIWSTFADGEFCSKELLSKQEKIEIELKTNKTSSSSDVLLYCQCTSPVNIAVIKYWGKRDEKLILPTNSSLSVTLNQNDLKTTTLVLASLEFEKDKMWLNSNEEQIEKSDRLKACLSEIRRLAGPKYSQFKLHVWSNNNFPTAAGLASSASGLSAFVYTIAQLFRIKEEYPGQLSTIARQGSGSACRSLYGGFVKWERGNLTDGSDSMAIQVAPETHWPELQVLICVVSDQKKDVSSTSGMHTTTETSTLFKERLNIVPERMKQMENAILKKDFDSFAKITMMDSNSFHSVCLDTYPPIFYLNDVSKKIIHLITKWNQSSDHIKAAYTFDAGPNAVIYTLKENMQDLIKLLFHYFPKKSISSTENNNNNNDVNTKFVNNESLLQSFGVPTDGSASPPVTVSQFEPSPGTLKYILTTPGPGPFIERINFSN